MPEVIFPKKELQRITFGPNFLSGGTALGRFTWSFLKKFRYGCSPVNLLHIFITPFPTNTSWGLLLNMLDKTIIEFNQNNKSYKFS